MKKNIVQLNILFLNGTDMFYNTYIVHVHIFNLQNYLCVVSIRSSKLSMRSVNTLHIVDFEDLILSMCSVNTLHIDY